MFVFVGAPADSVLRGGGAERAPDRLRELGFARALGADLGNLPVRIRGDERDPVTGIVAAPDVLAVTRTIREAIREQFQVAGRRPVVCGGCCGVLPGSLAGARPAGWDLPPDRSTPGRRSLLRGARVAPRTLVDEDLVGVSIGCFNPDKDADGRAGDELAGLLVRLFGDGA
jgi:hypothetical protein